MSTKIYDAYEWTAQFPTLLSRLKRMRKDLFEKAVVNALLYTNVEKFRMFTYVDALTKAIRSRENAHTDAEYGTIPNPESSALIFLQGRRIFVRFFGLPGDYKVRRKHLRDYHYQNQTDTAVPSAKWEERRRMWDAIHKDDDRPSHSGLGFPFIETSDALRIAAEMFRRLHDHDPWPSVGCQKATACAVCKSWREKTVKAEVPQ